MPCGRMKVAFLTTPTEGSMIARRRLLSTTLLAAAAVPVRAAAQPSPLELRREVAALLRPAPLVEG